jgi:prevent-host-death family protein
MSKHAVDLRDLEGKLARLVEEAARGEEVVITRDGEPVAQIIPIERKKPREFGSGKGMFTLAPDFDEPLEDFKDYE